MIVDTYIPTRTMESVELRVITNSAAPVTCQADGRALCLGAPAVAFRGHFFYSHWFSGLAPGQPLKLVLEQEGVPGRRQLQSSARRMPVGRHLLRFSIHADTHLSTRYKAAPGCLEQGKRLYSRAEELCRKYLARSAQLGAEFIILPGDVVDPATPLNVELARDIFTGAGIPCYALIGNHEPWGGSERFFYRSFGFPPAGYMAFERAGVLFLLLATPVQEALDAGSGQLAWLKNQLEKHGSSKDILIFSHFSLILHPCVQGWKNDGMQQLYNYKEVLRLLARYPRVRCFFAGHKNVPSRVTVDGVAHILCPQLIQAPCSFVIIDVYEDAIRQTIYEIEEQHYLWVSRQAFGSGWPERYGREKSRNWLLEY